MSKISELIDEIKIYKICDHCDHYDTTKRCRIGDEGCNCKEEIERQIVAEIRADAIDECIEEIQISSLMEWEKLIVISILEQLKEYNNEQ